VYPCKGPEDVKVCCLFRNAYLGISSYMMTSHSTKGILVFL